MIKAEIVKEIAHKTGIEKLVVLTVLDSTMETIKESLTTNKNVYLRGFGTFFVKKKASKPARIITKKLNIIIPAHKAPAFKPAKTFVERIKTNVKVK